MWLKGGWFRNRGVSGREVYRKRVDRGGGFRNRVTVGGGWSRNRVFYNLK